MASDTGSCADGEGFVIPTDKTSSTFQDEEISSERRDTFPKSFTLRPIVTCSSSSASFSSSSAASFSSSSSSSGSPCSVFRASKPVEKASSTDNILNTNEEEICTTPKAKEYKIPEHLPCPPAPRKRRVSSRFHSVPLTGFFIPPDLDSMFSMHKIPVNM
ncbi:hypothetical protein SUGI_0356890 [Cryptomeria japonica]|uniref:cyclin-dependent protein kinase inhibitor SMR15 n=1 Tax=Cryptomeria japonica TaxID=3369 RepID=UPI002408EA01|nr:cyclin-dependent protein kinase inhibitor SMR15 [Cryptomeria japonica]GLJ19696.1 hypothetical protein SUGI_0356890 [Cryptomeria japonica]